MNYVLILIILLIYSPLFYYNKLVYPYLMFLVPSFVKYDVYHKYLSLDVGLGRLDILDVICMYSLVTSTLFIKKCEFEEIKANKNLFPTVISIPYLAILAIFGYILGNDYNFILNDTRMVLYFYSVFYITSMVSSYRLSNSLLCLVSKWQYILILVLLSAAEVIYSIVYNEIDLSSRISDEIVSNIVGFNTIFIYFIILSCLEMYRNGKTFHLLIGSILLLTSFLLLSIPLIRGIIFSTIFTIIIVMLFMSGRYLGFRLNRSFIFILLFTFFLTIYITMDIPYNIPKPVNEQIDLLIKRADIHSEEFESNRIAEIRELLRQYNLKELIIGKGIGGTYDPTLAYRYNIEWWRTGAGNLYLHSNYFTLILKGGIICMFLFGIYWITVWKNLFIYLKKTKSHENKIVGVLLFCWLFYTTVVNLFDPMYDSKSSIFLGLLSASIGKLTFYK